ncbi:MAG: O-methyltransferase [Oscillospiraceae bacterium]|jgi:predicted O-methyltransferase YrrM|nr:O-methyltransferase [Oscillospiraceae bacterium]
METWESVDDFFSATIVREDDALLNALRESRKHGLPEWEVSPAQGQFLYILAKMAKAKRILELGTLGGYSTIWLARALPDDGALVTLEYDEKYAEVARGNIDYAGLSDKVTVMQGAAAGLMKSLVAGGEPPFDMIFIDADKPNNPLYLELALKLSARGTVIFGDNVVRDGELANAQSTDPKVRGVREYIADLGRSPNIISTGLQTVGCKGYDGFTISIVE